MPRQNRPSTPKSRPIVPRKPKRPAGGSAKAALGPSQRQLRAGELVRHALATILREEEIADPVMAGVSITVAEVRVSPDLRHATCFVEPLGGAHADEVVKALNRHAKFIRGRLGHQIELKFTPDLHFVKDESFDAATRMNALFAKPEVARDLKALPLEGEGLGGGVGTTPVGSQGDVSPSDAAPPAHTPNPDPSPLEGEGS